MAKKKFKWKQFFGKTLKVLAGAGALNLGVDALLSRNAFEWVLGTMPTFLAGVYIAVGIGGVLVLYDVFKK